MPEDTCGSPHPTLDLVCTRSMQPHPCRGYHSAPYAPAQDSLEVWLEDARPIEHAPRRRTGEALKEKKGTSLDPKTGPPDPANPYGKPTQDEGMRQAFDAASPEFKEALLDSIRKVALVQPTLVSDDVWDEMDRRGVYDAHRGAIGTILSKTAVKRGWIKNSGQTTKTRRADQREHGLTVWASLIYSEANDDRPVPALLDFD